MARAPLEERVFDGKRINMWSNLKVRTCITLVLGLFLVAMLVSNGMAWLGMSSSNDKLERVNNAYSNQAVPAYDAYVMLLRARLNIVSSMMDLQEGRLKESADTLAHAQRQAGEARERFEAFLAVAKASSGADRVGAVETAFHAYLEVAARQMEAMQNQRLGEFVQLNPSAQRLNTAFDTAASAYLDRIDTDTDALVDDARAEHLRANTVTLVLIVLALALCAGCGVFIGRAVLRPLKEAGQHFDRIAAGDLTARVDVRNSNEIGQLFAGLKRMEESLTRTVAAVRRGWTRSTWVRARFRPATRTCPATPKSRRPRWKRPRPRWSSWPRRSSRTPTTRARPTSWRESPRTWPSVAVRRCPRW
ncbi:methyl-accepting chemotaxis protein I [Bordetella pertussis]|nr:methyl-accepting chemotaxis protein I [Bordetella pertussis]